LNVGPQPDGAIGPEFTQRLLEVGKWLATYGDSVYGTSRGPIPPQPWGVSTAKGPPEHPREIYLHIINPKDDAPITFHPSLAWSPHVFGTKMPLKLTRSQRELMLELPKNARLPIDTIVVLTPLHAGRP
jgi:alpha-L-fucosidase